MSQRTPFTALAAQTAAELMMCNLDAEASAIAERLYEYTEKADFARRKAHNIEDYSEVTHQWEADRRKFDRRRAESGPQRA